MMGLDVKNGVVHRLARQVPYWCHNYPLECGLLGSQRRGLCLKSVVQWFAASHSSDYEV